jgi:hypothetical protein
MPTQFARWLLIGSFAALVLGFLITPTMDPDVFLHLRDGRFLLSTHFQPGNDPFSYSAGQRPFEKVEWAFQALISLGHQAGGIDFVIWLKALLVAAILVLLGWQLYRRAPALEPVLVLLGLGMLAWGMPYVPERPYLATYLALVLILPVLEQTPNQDLSAWRRGMIGITLGIPLWVNLHPGMLILFPLWAAYTAELNWQWFRQPEALARQRLQEMILFGAVWMICAALSPLGFKLFQHVWQMASDPIFTRSITEWTPPQLASDPSFFLLLGMTWAALLIKPLQVRPAHWMSLLFFSWLAIKNYRHIALFILVSLPVLTRQVWSLRSMLPPRLRGWEFPAWVRVCLAFFLLGLTFWFAASGATFRFGVTRNLYPGQALEFIESRLPPLRIFSHDIWGGYIGWKTLGRIKVFMDGRLPLFGSDIYRDYQTIIYGRPGALELLDRYAIDAVLISPGNEQHFFEMLWNSRAWTLVYFDANAMLYLRKTVRWQAYLERFGFQSIDPKHRPFFDLSQPHLALAELVRATQQMRGSFLPWYLMGEYYVLQKKWEPAANAFAEAVALEPEHWNSQLQLARCALALGDHSAARKRLRSLMRFGIPASVQRTATRLLHQIVESSEMGISKPF